MNPDIIRQITDQDYAGIARRIRQALLDRLEESSAPGFVLGLSGGIDSVVTASLCRGLSGRRTLAMIMPDLEITPEAETADALDVAGSLGIEHRLLDIGPIVEEYAKHLRPHPVALGNLRARIRCGMLYYCANAEGLLVAGSSDRSEYQIGYFTKFGDGAADAFPIRELYKLQVREMAGHLGVPPRIISKRSSPHLWKGHEAESEIGASYEEVDAILHLYLDKGTPLDMIPGMAGVTTDVTERVIALHRNSAHKRQAS